jgi:hypothetical protein
MENFYKKMEKIFDENNFEEQNEDILKEILFELREIKALLSRKNKKMPKDYYKFVNDFREKLKENPYEGKYPEFKFNGRILAINQNGFLYDKNTNKLLSTSEAFMVYEKLFEKRNEIYYEGL